MHRGGWQRAWEGAGETSETQPYLILIRLSRPRIAVLRLAARNCGTQKQHLVRLLPSGSWRLRSPVAACSTAAGLPRALQGRTVAVLGQASIVACIITTCGRRIVRSRSRETDGHSS